MKILISERDQHERIVIEWLISAYSFPINHVITATTIKETIIMLEKETPDILYIELDMIPNENWASMTRHVKRFCKKVIVVSAEATFERAKQALEWQSIDLLVKPLEPIQIKRCLQMALSNAAIGEQKHSQGSLHNEGYSYRSLFLNDEQHAANITLILLQTENQKVIDLASFLSFYPFREQPVILPLMDAVVCLFRDTGIGYKEEAWKILREWEAVYIEPLAAVIIPSGTEDSPVHDKYLKARSLLEVTFFIGYRQVVLPRDEYECRCEVDPFLTPNEQREWIDMLNSFDKQKIKEWMHNEFLHIHTPFPNPETLRTRLTSILAQIRRFMKTYSLDKQDVEKYYMKIFTEILKNSVLYRIVQEMLLFIYQIIDWAQEAEVDSKNDIIEKGISYIESHYSNPNLSLEKVAEAVGRNPSYYSHVLMNKHGTPFRQLLTTVRVKEAKRLLTGTELSIKEIAYQVGFNNPNYFTRLFKEATSFTPREYRLNK
jgi:YesN/AraC family two-component response regulator